VQTAQQLFSQNLLTNGLPSAIISLVKRTAGNKPPTTNGKKKIKKIEKTLDKYLPMWYNKGVPKRNKKERKTYAEHCSL